MEASILQYSLITIHITYVWVYVYLKHKGKAFKKFREKKAIAEKSSQRKVKDVIMGVNIPLLNLLLTSSKKELSMN